MSKVLDLITDIQTLGEAGYNDWLTEMSHVDFDTYFAGLEERSLLESNANLADRLRREGIISTEMVVDFRRDEYGRYYVEVVTSHGRSELVLQPDYRLIRKANLD